jgi:hypothetical protein
MFDLTPGPDLPGESSAQATWSVNTDGTGLARWPVNLGDPGAQFGFPFDLSRDGQNTAFVGVDSTGQHGITTIMRVDGSGRKQLFATR